MKCPKCQADNREGRKFCSQCASPLATVCPVCKAVNEPGEKFCGECAAPLTGETQASPAAPPSAPPPQPPSTVPTSFASGRYVVKKFLGEGGKKKVYLAHDTVLDRDIAFALIKTEKLDEAARTRIKREAQAMGRLGDHPNIVTVFDFGDHEGQPYMVLPLLTGGDIEHLIEKAPDHRLPLDKAIEITRCVCKGLEFAHGKGIIHRDIKPGNVWMSADGIAKVGDFGLAVAVNLSRLTQDGMMVGTVSYMPPEQAMGGKVSARADLYSLGAMLYEMVTGRPPFVGDDQVAIIGQHINTPPVSPAWHRADLPPSLETLIMRLLEKDPDKRPESATMVLRALESIGADKVKPEPAKATASAENPIYRRVFVGREGELKQLQSAFDGAVSGQGALMMVMGEPGIGKTALCEQLATYITLRGGRTMVGHCYEEGSLSLPYLAFVEALRSYVLSREVKDLREELGTGAADVARIVSEIRERLKLKLRPQTSPEEERYRLLEAVTAFLSNAAAVQPLAIVLEDLHDADKGTLEMLIHLSRHLSGTRLLIIGTYRDVEVDRAHPLSAALAELRRVSTYGRVLLRGLNADEVSRMLQGIAGHDLPWGLAEAVHRQTEGNPLFVQEVVRFLAEEKLLTRQDGRWRSAGETPVETSIPEGLRDVIGKRISRLSPECNQLLSVASVIGREFELETLKRVAGISEEAFVNALKEAVRLSVLEERRQVGSVRYRFTHAFFRQTLYEEMIAPQRLKLHQQVARSLETQHAGRLDEHAAELAEHFSQSTDPADLQKAVTYGEMAAQRAIAVYAWGEAVRLLDQAIKVQRVFDSGDNAKICDLLLGLCEALLQVPEAKRVLDIEGPAAFALAESLGDGLRAARACRAAIMANFDLQGSGAATTPQHTEWAARMDRWAPPGTRERVYANYSLAISRIFRGDRSRDSMKFLMQVLESARSLGATNPTFLGVAGWVITVNSWPQYAEENRRLAEEILASPGFKSSFYSERSNMGGNVVWILLTLGQRRRAEEVLADISTAAERTGRFGLWINSSQWKAVLATMDGRLEEAMGLGAEMRIRVEQAGTNVQPAFLSDSRARILLGAPLDEQGFTVDSPIYRAVARCLVRSYQGQKEEVVKILDEFVVSRPGIGTAEDEGSGLADTLFLEASVLVGHKRAAELLYNRLNGTGIVTSGRHITLVARHLGGAVAMLGRPEEARAHYQEAVKIGTELRFRPEIALTRLQFAELLLDHYPAEKKEALEHLDFAIKEFREMKMQPSLERALRRKEILKA